jgi:hypothetical protein
MLPIATTELRRIASRALGGPSGSVNLAVRQQPRKLVPSETREHVAPRCRAPETESDAPQNLIAHGMPMQIVVLVIWRAGGERAR